MKLIRLDNRILAVLMVALLAVGVAAGYELESSGGTTKVSTESIVSTTASVSTATSVSTTTIAQPTTETTTRTTTVRVTEPAPGEIPSITTIEEGNITIEGYPNTVAVNYLTGMLYITDIFSNVLTIVNGTTDSVTAAITMPATPTGIVVDSSTNTVFVSIGNCTNVIDASNSCDSTQSVTTPPEIFAMNGSTNRVFWTIRVNAIAVAVDEGRGVLYATQGQMAGPVSNSTGSLLAVSASSGLLMANISLDAYPGGVALDSRTHTLYVSACPVVGIACEGAEVLVINATNSVILTKIPVPGWGFSGMILDTFTSTGYLVVYSNVTKLVSINLNSDKEVYSTVLGSTCADISLLGIDLFKGQLYAVASGGQPTSDLLLVISAETGDIVNMFSAPGQIVGFTPGYNGLFYSTIESLSPHQTSGSLVSLSESFPTGFVNTGLIASGVCLP